MNATLLTLARYEYMWTMKQFLEARGIDIIFTAFMVGRAYKNLLQAKSNLLSG